MRRKLAVVVFILSSCFSVSAQTNITPIYYYLIFFFMPDDFDSKSHDIFILTQPK
jgi:hypothetical protein